LTRILVTGAGGFIGRRLLARLAHSEMEVRATSRGNPPALIGDGMEWMPADLTDDAEDLHKMCEECDAVAHLAALAHRPSARESDYHLHNHEATRRLAQAAAEAGVTHFLFISTAGVFGGGYPPDSDFEGYCEDDPPRPRDAYAASKARAEESLIRIAGSTAMTGTILRPPLVYGPDVPANFLQLMRGVAGGLPLPLASVNNRRSLMFVDNLCDLIHRVLDRADPSGGIYGVADMALSAPELVRVIAGGLSVKPRLFPVPLPVLKAAGTLTGRRGMIERLTQSFVIDDSAVRRDFDWQPPVSLEEGMRVTGEWFRNSDKS